ncbi:secreted seminal-vesicle Ly-6 protein 1-like isoform X2 [Crotalus tigris]|uniref:secreted seminal-vesicle Ly-6 protein 1-like isoform X2 n=1 Tax=Crotalus tigris TaxID=88082 RepID=UPI00192F7149|nr:secreted seminal-vesicle Ly-6 protein 1-like isoform X2 [Crotalus tigris]
MSKTLWYSFAILLCSALAEALTCIKCKNFKLAVSRCINKEPSRTCIAKQNQPCQIIKYYEGEEMKSVFFQGCRRRDMPCNTTGSITEGTMFESICCDHEDLCNTP